MKPNRTSNSIDVGSITSPESVDPERVGPSSPEVASPSFKLIAPFLGLMPTSSASSSTEESKKSDKNRGWKIIKEGSRKRTDLLVDEKGNTYTKRSPYVWQCTRKSNSQKNKCPALVREKNENGQRIFVIKGEHHHYSPPSSSVANTKGSNAMRMNIHWTRTLSTIQI